MPGGRKSAVDSATLHCPCEWSDCGLLFNSLSILQEHQLDHFKEQYCHQNLSYFITCRICEAQLDTADFDAIERHSHYHVWTLSLRVYGQHVQQMNEWPECLHTPSTFALPPNLPTKFDCVWEYCNFSTNDIFAFYDHVSEHPEEYTDSRYARDTPLRCLWGGCGYVANWLKNLHSHLDVHTQRKHIGCPKCGMLFESRIKFEDHLKRQQEMMLDEPPGVDGSGQLHPSVNPVSCPRCPRAFVNESLLITHMKRHIDRIKCQFCDITVWGKTELDRHVLLRHTDKRRFPCPHCDYRSKTSSALKSHIEQTHFARATTSISRSQDGLVPGVDVDELCHHVFLRHERRDWERFHCPYCDYQAKTSSGLKSHMQLMHFARDNASTSRRLGILAPDMDVTEPEFDDRVFFRHEESNEERFSCPHCDYQGQTSSSLKSHMQRMHFARDNASTSRKRGRLAPEVDVDDSAITSIGGPFAETGAMSLFDDDIGSPTGAGFTIDISSSNMVNTGTAARDAETWIFCHVPGCRFKTTRVKSYRSHYRTKHLPATSSPQPSPVANRNGFYVSPTDDRLLDGGFSSPSSNLVSRAPRTTSVTSNAKAARAKKDWIYCDQPGCKFKTTTRKGYGMHFSIKHMPRSPSPANEEDKVGYYVCHLCPEMRKKSHQMTRHLRRDHQLTNMRLMFTLGCDGKFRFQPNHPDPVPPEPPLVGKLPITRAPRKPVSPVRKRKESTAPPVVGQVSAAPAPIGQASASSAPIGQASASSAPIGQALASSALIGQVSAAPFLIGQLSATTPVLVQLSVDPAVVGQLSTAPPTVGQVSAVPIVIGQVSASPLATGKVKATPHKKRVARVLDEKPAASARGRKPLAPVLLKLPITPLVDKVPIFPVPVGKVPISRLVKHAPLPASTATPTSC